jgi:hypothetical protein
MLFSAYKPAYGRAAEIMQSEGLRNAQGSDQTDQVAHALVGKSGTSIFLGAADVILLTS